MSLATAPADPPSAGASFTTTRSGDDHIARAGREIWERRRDAQRSRAERDRIRQCVAAVDGLVSILEERHLSGERTFDRVLRQRLHRLEAEVGMPLPRKAIRARNTVRLHAALLDWQEAMLDQLLPGRLEFPDVHDNDWNETSPLGWEDTGSD